MLQDVNNTLISKFTERPDGELYDPDELLKREARKKRVQARLGEKKQMPLNEPKIANSYSGDAKFSHLSNFAPRDFVFQDKPYRNVEHAYQTLKSGTFNDAVYNKYSTVADVKQKITGTAKVDKEISISLMEEIVSTMYKQNPDAYQKLLDTKGMTIEHNVPGKKPDIWTKEMPRILTALRDDGLDAFVKVTDEVASVIKVDKFWDRAKVAADTEYTYLFGDNTNDRLNTQHTPTKTQAVIRGLPNAIGIDTRYSRTEDFADTDDNFARFQQHVDEQIQKALDIGKPIKVSAGGFATGAGVGLPQRFKDYLNNAIDMISSASGTKAVENSVVKIFYPYADKNSITNHANSYKKIMEEKYPNLTVEIVNNKSQADMVFGRGQGMGNPFSHESKHGEVIVKTRFFDETMIMYEAWLKGEPMPEDTVPITPEQQEKLNTLRNEWLSKTQKYIPGSSVGAMAADVETKINDIKIDDSIVQDVLKNLPGWFIVPIEQAAETVLRRIGIAGAASLASKLIKYELQTFATAIASGAIAAGTSALTVPQTAQAMLLTGNYDEYNKRVDTLEEDMMENAKINGGMMMGIIVRAMPSYWLDEWFLKRNPEFKNTWKETFPQMGVTPGFRHVGDTIAKGWNSMFPKDKDNE